MKRIFIASVVLVLSMSLTACGGTDTAMQEEAAQTPAPAEQPAQPEPAAPAAEAAPEQQPAPEPQPEPEPAVAEAKTEGEVAIGEPFKLGEYDMVITDISKVPTYDDKTALKVVYTWTNGSEETQTPSFTYILRGFQNGVETENTPFSKEIDLGIGQKEVRPGVTLEGVEDGVELVDDSPIELELSEIFSFSSKTITMTVDPSTL